MAECRCNAKAVLNEMQYGLVGLGYVALGLVKLMTGGHKEAFLIEDVER